MSESHNSFSLPAWLRRLHTVLVVFVLFAGSSSGLTAAAQDQRGKAASTSAAKKSRERADTFGRPDGSEVIRFAETHHPELADLLRQLRAADSPEFDRAVGEIAIQIERIERFRSRAPARFESELKGWKTDSQIKLLVARWAMSQDPELEQQIRALLKTRQAVRFAQLQQEKKRLRQRLLQVDEQIAAANSGRNAKIDDEFTRLTRKVKAVRNSRKGERRRKTTTKKTRQ
jgi:uncharacterized protein YgiM (DUF1202 family)